MSQQSFSPLDYAHKMKQTKRDKFPTEMDAVVPWDRLTALIKPHYPRTPALSRTPDGGGRRPYPLQTMLRIYFLQQWYGLSDPGAEEALYDSHAMRLFAGVDLSDNAIPDETTILNFRHLLEKHELAKALFDEVVGYLEERKLLLRGGTIMDATLIAAPPSAKNKDHKRDPEMSPSKKGNHKSRGKSHANDRERECISA